MGGVKDPKATRPLPVSYNSNVVSFAGNIDNARVTSSRRKASSKVKARRSSCKIILACMALLIIATPLRYKMNWLVLTKDQGNNDKFGRDSSAPKDSPESSCLQSPASTFEKISRRHNENRPTKDQGRELNDKFRRDSSPIAEDTPQLFPLLSLPNIKKESMGGRPYEKLLEIKLLQKALAPPTAICACAKCGSTSFYETIYKISHGAKWNFTGPPWVQNLRSQRWSNVAVRTPPRNRTRLGNSIALIRDPKERLLSAWRSKVTCAAGADKRDRAYLVPQLLDLAGINVTAKSPVGGGGPGDLCLDLPDYVEVLYAIHAREKVGEIDRHFVPQHVACFRDDPPSEWTVVTTADSPDLACRLRLLLLGTAGATNTTSDGDDCAMRKVHSTKKHHANLSARSEAMFDAITREEYALLGPYLK